MRNFLFWLGLLLCLGVPNGLVINQERLRAGSVLVYLRIAPEGVRIYGGQANLSYDLSLRPLDPGWPSQGFLQPDLDTRRVVNAWAPGTSGIRYEVRGQSLWLGDQSLPVPPDRFDAYRGARYARFDLTRDGRLILRGLTDASLNPL
ncbi:MAG: hypothetical protein U0931_33595 [Vulcanimicrobiota bacterium]